MKKIVVILALVMFSTVFSGCEPQTAADRLSIAYQPGITYAPMMIIREQNLIEKHYGEAVDINWQILTSGSAINEGVIAGEIDVACIGIAPFITGVSKGIDYKLYSSMSEQPMGLNSIDSSITKLSDFSADDKIALVSYGSIQHIMLGMAAEKELGDAHALDNIILNMANSDGMQALISGSVSAHLTIMPYYNMELEREDVAEIKGVPDAFPEGATIVAAAAATKLYEQNRKLYDALVAATNEAMDYINNHTREAAEFLCEEHGVTADVMEKYLNDERCNYVRIPNGVLEIAEFMERADFAENVPTTLEEIYFDDLLEIAGE